LALPLLLLHGIDAGARYGWRASVRSVPLLVWAALALGLVQTLATIFSTDSRASLWGSTDRQQGLVTQLSILTLFLLAATAARGAGGGEKRSKRRVERLFRAIAWGSVPVVAYGFLQALGIDPLGWRTDSASPVLSTLGRSNFVGAYLVLVVPATAATAWLARRRWPYALLLAAQGGCLVLTRARSAWAGGAAGLLAAGVLYAVLSRRWRWLWWSLAGLGCGIALLFALTGGDGPLASLLHADSGSTAARLAIWKAAWPLVTSRPWLGHGPETFKAAFLRVYPPQLVYYQGRHVVVDRAHNLWIDLGASAGAPGVAAFAVVLVTFGGMAARALRARTDRWQRVVWMALIASAIGHLVDLQFSFELTAGATIFWLLLGSAIAVSSRPSDDRSAHRERPRQEAQTAADAHLGARLLPWLLPSALVLALIVWLCGRPLLADVACWQAQQTTDDPPARAKAAERAVRFWPVEPQYRLLLAENAWAVGQRAAAQAELDAAIQLAPGDAQIWAASGALYARWGQVDPVLYRRAERAYRQALAMSPTVAAWHTSLGVVLARQGQLGDAIAALERAVDLDATDGAAAMHLANAYHAAGRYGDAYRAWLRAEQRGWKGG
jgi:O-antigen ligase